MIRRIVVLCAATAALTSVAVAQGTQRCDITGKGGQTAHKLPSGQYNSFMGGGVFARCPAKQLTLRADSLENYGDEGRIFFLGHVEYEEPRLALTSDFLTYYQKDERIVAQGDVDAKLPNGSTMKGPWAEYFRVIPGTRLVPRLHATGRPLITITKKDSTGQPTPPTSVVANDVTMVGDSIVYAYGGAEVTREDIYAHADSINMDSEREIVILTRNPTIQGRGKQPFTLSGDRIELTSRLRKLTRVVSKGTAKALSKDMTLESDTIDLRVATDLLQRAIAWGPARARASSAAQHIVADSIDVDMPNQRVREMHALRKALAEGRSDSTRFRADTTDWLRGDTIVARFDTIAAGDTARSARLRALLAIGNAKSYYHLPASDTTLRLPAINYVVGRQILVDFQQQRVSKVTVVDKAAGVFVEPRAVASKSDSTGAARPGPVPAPPPRAVPVPAATRRPPGSR